MQKLIPRAVGWYEIYVFYRFYSLLCNLGKSLYYHYKSSHLLTLTSAVVRCLSAYYQPQMMLNIHRK